jgi:hypothetical protein
MAALPNNRTLVTAVNRSHSYTAAMRSLAVFLLLAYAAQAPAWSSEPTPLWKIDVRQFGYVNFPRKAVRPIELSVAFIGNAHIAVVWISPDRTKSNQNKEPHWGDGAHVHVVVIDGKSGQKEVEKEWPTPFTYASPRLVGVADGKFLICTDNALRMLSATLDVVQEQQLPSQTTCNPSPSGHTLLVSSLSGHTRQMKVMDTETFKVLSSWTEQTSVGELTIGFSDHWLVGYCGDPSELCIRRFDESWQALHVSGIETHMDRSSRILVSFVNDEVLAIKSKDITLVTVHGAMLFQIAPAPNRWFGLPAPSSSGESFVIVEGRQRGATNEVLDMYPFYSYDRAAVYGIKDHQSHFSLKLQGTSPWTPWHIIENVVASSPDGGHLALISDGVLQLYAVPVGS